VLRALAKNLPTTTGFAYARTEGEDKFRIAEEITMTSVLSSGNFDRLPDEYLKTLFDTYPAWASSLGLHDYDGRVQDFREIARAGRISTLRSWAARLARFSSDALDSEDAHDQTLLSLAVDKELFDLEEMREFERNPMAYSEVDLDVSGYVKRNYEPFPKRVEHLTEHLRHFPDVLTVARKTLHPQIPRPVLETSLDVYAGMIQFHEDDLPAAVQAVGSGPLWTAFERANTEALAALKEFARYLDENLKPRATLDFPIGEDRFRAMLRLGEMVDVPLDRLLAINREDMIQNQALLSKVIDRVAPGKPIQETIRTQSKDHPTADRLVPEAARVLEELRDFILMRRLVSIPSDVRCLVEETPPFARWAFAMMDTSGPFETATESFYYVTPPEPEWTLQQKEEWLAKFDYATLRDVGIHEVYPGHYIHFLHMKHVPRRIRQVLSSYSFEEGWAHYCEQMMLEAGYREGDSRLQVAQLSEALLRNVRFLVSIQMHARGMTLEEATQKFVDEAYLQPLAAKKEAERGTFDPGYLNYTLGKLMLLRLRDDLREMQGGRFAPESFHDSLLALGAPPIPLARRRLLGKNSGAL
jgi:uncharacterized protein (DUF885 family)